MKNDLCLSEAVLNPSRTELIPRQKIVWNLLKQNIINTKKLS